jgi:hypothetical protein
MEKLPNSRCWGIFVRFSDEVELDCLQEWLEWSNVSVTVSGAVRVQLWVILSRVSKTSDLVPIP